MFRAARERALADTFFFLQNQYLAVLQTYGYKAELTDYIPWASSLENYVSNNTDFALMPLFTFVANDLPSNTRAPELDDSNAEKSLYADASKWTGEDVSAGAGVTKTEIGKVSPSRLVDVLGFFDRKSCLCLYNSTASISNADR